MPNQLFLYKERLVCQPCSSSFSVEGSSQPQPQPNIPDLTQKQANQIKVKQVKRRKSNSMERLLTLLKENPSASQKELSENLDLTQGRVSQLLKDLKTREA